MCNATGTYLQHIKHNMRIIDQLLTILTPYECLGCSNEGNLLCTACIQQLTPIPERCYRCLIASPDAFTCPNCTALSLLYRLRAASPYSGIAKELVGRLKFSGAQAAAERMALCLRSLLESEGKLLIMPVPTASSRVRTRGYDQAKLLARELSRQTRLPYLDGIARSGHTHQVGASRERRKQQLHGAFRVTTPRKIQARHILLVDDVITTGATLEAAAKVLRASGAAQVEAVVFCAA